MVKVHSSFNETSKTFHIEFHVDEEGNGLYLSIPLEQAELLSRSTDAKGLIDLIFARDLVNNFVDSMYIDGKVYSKSDVRTMITECGEKK